MGPATNNLSSLNGYAPLANFWAAHGFVVIQPTHLSSTTLSLNPDYPGGAVVLALARPGHDPDARRLDEIEAAVVNVSGRVDRTRVGAVGHSMGGHTISLLLGARLSDPHDGSTVDLTEPRISAGVLLASTGRGGDALTDFVTEHYPFLSSTDFSQMTTPALVVAGDKDASAHLTVAGPDWHTDPYVLSPGPKSLLTLFDAEHGLGGVSGYDVAETTDGNPPRVSAVQLLSWAYLRTQLYPKDAAWQAACDALTTGANALGRVESEEV